MATITFAQTTLGLSSSTSVAHCSGLSNNGNAISVIGIRDGGTPGEIGRDSGVNNASVRKTIYFESDAVGETVWASGDYVFRFRIVTGNALYTLDEIHICRMNSSFVSQETLATETSIGRVMTDVGTETVTVAGSAATSPASSDLLLIICGGFRNGDHGNQNITIMPDQDIDTPIVRTGAGAPPGAYLQRFEHMPAPNPSLRM